MSDDALAQLRGYLMDIMFVEVEFLSNLGIGEIEAHQIPTQNPDAKRLMMTSKDGVGQIVKAPLTGLTPIALPLGLSVIAPLFRDLQTLAMGDQIKQRYENRCRGWMNS